MNLIYIYIYIYIFFFYFLKKKNGSVGRWETKHFIWMAEAHLQYCTTSFNLQIDKYSELCFEVIFAFGEIFFNQRVLLQLDLHWRQPQTSMTNETNLRTFCFKDHRYESFFLSRDSLSGATHSLDLCVLFKFIFLYLRIHSAPFLRFSSVLLTPIFSYVYYHAEYFSYPWMMPLIGKRSKFNWNFSS